MGNGAPLKRERPGGKTRPGSGPRATDAALGRLHRPRRIGPTPGPPLSPLYLLPHLPPDFARAVPVILFLSDLHLGRGARQASRDAERSACAVLAHHGPGLTRVFVVGDLFEQYMEYRHLAPKGFVRFQAALAALTDRGVPVTYLLGNRDPWHLDYFREELGVETVPDMWEGVLRVGPHGVRTYLAHGDGLDPAERAYRRLKPLMRHPRIAQLYRMGLPGDAAYALARRVGHAVSDGGPPQAAPVAALRRAADRLLGPAPGAGRADLVAFGHVHHADLGRHPGGAYLNPGYFFGDRTYGALDAPHPTAPPRLRLFRWREDGPQTLATDAVPADTGGTPRFPARPPSSARPRP